MVVTVAVCVAVALSVAVCVAVTVAVTVGAAELAVGAAGPMVGRPAIERNCQDLWIKIF